MSINAINKHIEPLRLESLKQRGLEAFCPIDIRGKQSFLAAHLAHSVHLPSMEEIIAFTQSLNASKNNDFALDFASKTAKESAVKNAPKSAIKSANSAKIISPPPPPSAHSIP